MLDMLSGTSEHEVNSVSTFGSSLRTFWDALLYDQTIFCSLWYVISIFAVSSDKQLHFVWQNSLFHLTKSRLASICI